jgi:hypothetical protein
MMSTYANEMSATRSVCSSRFGNSAIKRRLARNDSALSGTTSACTTLMSSDKKRDMKMASKGVLLKRKPMDRLGKQCYSNLGIEKSEFFSRLTSKNAKYIV